jgi:hypothetical protein
MGIMNIATHLNVKVSTGVTKYGRGGDGNRKGLDMVREARET